MSRLPVVHVDPDGPIVDVASDVRLSNEGRFVGLIAIRQAGRGWCELTPGQARTVATALIRAARETEER